MTSRPGNRVRLDQLIVERGLAESRARAQALLLAGRIRAGAGAGARVDRRPGDLVAPDLPLAVKQTPAWVSRGGEKLAAALDRFLADDPGVDPAGRVCLDVGASTGGFTDVLLRRGARRVYALDVGRGQLAESLRTDPRVVSLEKVLGPLAATFAPGGGRIVALVKPQFEAGREQVRRGVVRDPAVHRAVLERIRRHAAGLGLGVRGETPSPLVGPAGNREFFLDLEVPPREGGT